MLDVKAMPHVADIPGYQADVRGDEVAFWYKEEETTFAQLEARSNQVANGLIALGVEADQRVGYLAKNTAVYYEQMFGCAKARAVMNGVNTRLAAPEVQFILSDAQVRVLFVGPDWFDMISEIKDECPHLEHVITVEGTREGWPEYTLCRDSQDTTALNLETHEYDDVIQLYTSGTTGLPKGVMLTNGNYKAFFEQAGMLEWSSYGVGEAVMNAMPLFHVAGVNVGILATAQGAKAVVLPEIDPTAILDLVESQEIVHAFWVPAVILMLSMHPTFKDRDYSKLKQVLYGASPIAEDLLRTAVDVMGARFTQLYGLTETVGAGTFLPVTEDDATNHKMHAEWGEVPDAPAAFLPEAKQQGARILPVGTTALRLLESAAPAPGVLEPWRGDTDIFITPGHAFRLADGLMTNFHLPKSTLMMLVSALMGVERIRTLYAHAIARKYRFYSYGDSSLLLPKG